MKPVTDLTDDELVLELSEKIQKKRKFESELEELERVRINHTQVLGLSEVRRMDLDIELKDRGKRNART